MAHRGPGKKKPVPKKGKKKTAKKPAKPTADDDYLAPLPQGSHAILSSSVRAVRVINRTRTISSTL